VSDATENVEAAPLAATVSRLADALASATSPHDIYEAALEGLGTAIGAERAAVLLFDADGVMRFRAWRGLSDEYRREVEGHSPWKPGEPSPTPVVIPDVTKDPALAGFQSVLAREDIRALVFAPLVAKRKAIGKFMVYWRRRHQPSRATLDAVMTIAAFLSLAVERVRQNAESREHEERMHAALEQEAEARERLARLAEGSQRLQISLDPPVVIQEILTLAQKAITADAYSVWRRNDGIWRIAASTGLDASFTSVELLHDERFAFTTPLVVEDVTTSALVDARRPAYEAAGIRALLSVPLQIRGRPGGTVTFYFHEVHRPTDLELRIAQALGQIAASAISSTELFAEQQSLRQRAVKSAERAEFLADVSARMTSLDYEQNLGAIANQVVPRFADWCVVDLIEGGTLRRLAAAHSDVAKLEVARELERRYPPRRDLPGGYWHVIRTGEPALYSHVTDAVIERIARDPEHLALLQSVGFRSVMLLPLKRGSDVFGVLSFVISGDDRFYDHEDLEFAQELARRASFVVENARLYRQAQEANRAKDEFLAALSHELRTPLNAILGWASILRARPDGEIERGLEVIYRNANVQAQLVEDLLDASRIVSGRMSIELRDVPLKPILQAAIETVLPSAVEKAIELTAQLPDPEVVIRGDSARLQQVFWNVLSNSVKFTPRGGQIQVRSQLTPAEIAIEISDTGAGIRPEALPFIFDRFKQADAATTTRRFRGLGLGLTLSRQLTEMHGGRITAGSPGPGLGSTFTVALPIVERAAIGAQRTTVGSARNALEGLFVLAVDDDPDSLEMLTSLLRSQSATVVGATSAMEALEMLQKEPPNVVVSDIAMPDHDGYWLMEQLRRLAEEGGPAVPCVALTAFANATVRERALSTGFVAHLSKPFDPDQLVHTLRNAVAAT
jgi:signal transduction histidine kinase/CheY-like chemotaxis protein